MYFLPNDVIFFMGSTNDASPAQGKRTLFVVGTRSIAKTIEYARENRCTHVHLGAQRSFQKNKIWDLYIRKLIEEGLTVTLEYPAKDHDVVTSLISADLLASNMFYPLLTFTVDCVEGIQRNGAIKLIGSNPSSNSGSWTHTIQDFLAANQFSDDSQLEFEIIERQQK